MRSSAISLVSVGAGIIVEVLAYLAYAFAVDSTVMETQGHRTRPGRTTRAARSLHDPNPAKEDS